MELCLYRRKGMAGAKRDACLQIAIENEIGGYRLLGPPFAGTSELIRKIRLSQSDAEQIRAMLDKAFPGTQGRGLGR